MSDYYAVMGVPRTATTEEVRAAYRRLALRWHPDRNPGDNLAEARFKEAGEAYETLSDAARRRAYDLGGRSAATGARPGSATVSVESFLGPIEELVGTFFSGLFGAAPARPGGDVSVQITLGLREAICGAVRQIEVPSREKCRGCGGEGRLGPQGAICVHCAGGGMVETGGGFISIRHTCHHCGGSGQAPGPACAPCGGLGLVEAGRRAVAVRIPAGVRDGTRLRFANQGDPARGQGPARGDLYCEIRVRTEATA